ncbi:MAG: type II toxin-antitoxin system Phd/YefM family antitoxin [Tepidisphaeraceae bacterium]|jgi:PHD/YefM family antitoxin component YafN of YafNO toxin-antitoxin module
MLTFNTSQARSNLSRLIAGAADEPVRIAGRRGNAVLISEADWQAMQETLYLVSTPGMRDSIRKGLKTPVARCKTELNW